MAPTTFRLVTLSDAISGSSFIAAARAVSPAERPLYVGKCHHWVHTPHLSSLALVGDGTFIQRWDYLVISRGTSGPVELPKELSTLVENEWSVTAYVEDQQLDSIAVEKRRRSDKEGNFPLPPGWSAQDHSGLDAAVPPSDLEASLALSSYPLGSIVNSSSQPTSLKDSTRKLGVSHSGPVDMFNLLSYLPGGRPQYFQYIAAFGESVGIKYGGEPSFMGLGGILDWSSKKDEQLGAGVGWEDTALVHYPSIWHFAAMLDDPAYADVDRKFKQGALRDNPLICCTEIDLE